VSGYTDASGKWVKTSSVTLYAQWTGSAYTITLNANGGSRGAATVTATYNAALPAFTAPTRTSYTLTGYFTSSSGGDKVINANGTLVSNVSGYTDASGKWVKTSSVTLYAQWQLPYEVAMVAIPNGTLASIGSCRVNIPVSSFKMSKYEVTQALWYEVMGNNPSSFKGDDRRPVEQVSWNEIQDFISKLNKLTGKNYRLPTEAEWEWAARGGQNYTYSGGNDLNTVGWSNRNANATTHPVGEKAANGYGLYDMSGNVYEWCSDLYSDDCNNLSPSNGMEHVARGGSVGHSANYCEVAYRYYYGMGRRHYVGFRLVLP
jgi:formylglycine-generating enzyme required for sulfatase activity